MSTVSGIERIDSNLIIRPLREDDLPQVREAELREACGILGVGDLTILDYCAGTLASVDRAGLVGQIVEAIRRVRPHVLLTFVQRDALCIPTTSPSTKLPPPPHRAPARPAPVPAAASSPPVPARLSPGVGGIRQ